MVLGQYTENDAAYQSEEGQRGKTTKLCRYIILLYAGHGGCVESAEESAVFNSLHDVLAVFNCGELSIADSCQTRARSRVSCKS